MGLFAPYLLPLRALISYIVMKICLIGLASSALFYSHKIYFYTFWLNLDKFLQRVIRYDFFVEERYNISRISDTCKNLFTCILLKHRYIPYINNRLLIRDLITCLWRHYWLNDVLGRLNKQKVFLSYKVNYGVKSREA